MRCDAIAAKLRETSASGFHISVSCDQIAKLSGATWTDLQADLTAGRVNLRGLPGNLREIDRLLHPWVRNVMIGIMLGIPIIAAIVFQSWSILLMIPLSWIGGFFGSKSCLGSAAYLVFVPLALWAAASGKKPLAICSAGLVIGAVAAGIAYSFDRVFAALRSNETLFSYFFASGLVWVEFSGTGEKIRCNR
jgi:hypothetical protein